MSETAAVTLVKVSVRELVAFVLRSGSLAGNRFVSNTRALEGTYGHQRLQGMRPPAYQTEVPIEFTVTDGDVALEISGRVDGLFEDAEENALLVEEIKTLRQPRPQDAPDNAVHWGQAKVYGAVLAQQRDLDEVNIQVTYLALDSWELQEDCRLFSRAELDAFFDRMVGEYLRWARLYQTWIQKRDRSIAALDFPHPEFRPGQKQLALSAFQTILGHGRLFAQAPTGIGKTASTLFAAVKALEGGTVQDGGRGAEKAFYLTAKTSGRLVAEETMELMREQGLRCKSLTLTARDKICFVPEGEASCNPDQCPYAIGYYDRLNDALVDIFERDNYTRPVIEEVARKHQVCPFEFSLDLSLWADIIICDYNYLFDPRAYLRRFFQDAPGNYTLLVDEAHNLVDRAREMFSAELNKRDVLALKRLLDKAQPPLGRKLEKLNELMLEMGKEISRKAADDAQPGVGPEGGEAYGSRNLPTDLLALVQDFVAAGEPVLGRNHSAAWYGPLLDFYYQAFGFARVAELYDESYVTYVEQRGRNVRVRLFCINPANNLGAALKRGTSALFFSATMTPLAYFRDLLGGGEEDRLLNLASPFPPDHLHLSVGDHIATTYRQRANTYDEVAGAIAAVTDQRPGNYLTFFPSYRYMEAIAARYAPAHPNLSIYVQRPGMREEEREAFLAIFSAANEGTTVGFAVMGGIFGEGIDLSGDRLVGAIVVGVGLPQICLERNLIKAYFDERELPGFAYAYTFPGMNRVLQAAGRVIRSESDRGVVLLIDQRFGHTQYRRLFPSHWQQPRARRSVAEIGEAVRSFWARQEGD